MRQSRLRRISLQGLALLAFVGLVNGHNGMSMSHQHSVAVAVETRTADDPWSHDQLIEPSGLATLLSSQNRPVVLQVGIIHFFRTSHVPGAKFAAPPDSAEGLHLL